MSVQFLFRRGTAAQWTSSNPVLGSGEPGFETDTGKMKIGNGSDDWGTLSYVQGSGGGGGSGTVTGVSVVTANGFSGTVANSTSTPAITLRTSVNGLVKGNGTALSAAVAGTDYQAPLTLTTTGSSGAATLIGNTLNVPQYPTNLNALTDVLLTSPSVGQVLKYDGTNWINDTDLNNGAGAVTLNDITDVVITSPSTGEVLTFNGTAWVNSAGGGGGAMASRAALQGSTGTLANGASGPINITGYKTYALLKIATSHAAWVRIYVSESARQADSTRVQGEDPLPGSGVIAEVITTAADTVLISPGTIGFNNEGPVTTNIPMRVTNLSGGSADITVTLTAVQLEA